MCKGKPRWLRALWIGKADFADAHLVRTSAGKLLAARSIRRTAVEYDASLIAALRDTPDQQVSFLAGKVGARRSQVTPKGVEQQHEGSGSDVAASDPDSVGEEVLDPADIAPAPSSVRVEDRNLLPGVPATPVELPMPPISSHASSSMMLPPGAAIAAGPVEPLSELGPNPALTHRDHNMPQSPRASFQAAVSIDVDADMPAAVSEPQESLESKRRRILSVSSRYQHSDEVTLLDDLHLSGDIESFDNCEYPPYGDHEAPHDEPGHASVPEVLRHPFRNGEPVLSDADQKV